MEIQKEKPQRDSSISEVQARLQQLQEMTYKNLDLQSSLSVSLHSGISQFLHLLEWLPSESRQYRGDLSTSFASVEIALAQHISGCLQDVPEQKRGIRRILKFLRDYKVVGCLPGGSHSASLQTVHSILQDNYPGSSLCGLFNMLLGCSKDVATKVVTFY